MEWLNIFSDNADKEGVLSFIKSMALVGMAVFIIYKIFFQKNRNDVLLDSEKLKLLKELNEFEIEKFKQLLEDYKKLEENEAKLKKILSEQDALIKKYKKRNIYLESELKKNKIPYKEFEE